MELADSHNYASGELVEVTEDLLRSTIQRAETTLGLDHQDHNFKIQIFPNKIFEMTGIRAAYSSAQKTFVTPKIQHEATLFHESTHYLMHQEGLLFGPDLRTATLYDRLVDETIAEFATSTVFGYNAFASDLVGFYRGLKEGKPEALEILREQNPGTTIEQIASAVAGIDFPQLELFDKHKEIERTYMGTEGNFQAIQEGVEQLYQFIDRLPQSLITSTIPETVNMLSVENAISMNNAGVEPRKIVSQFKEGVKHSWDSYGLYFYNIVTSLNRSRSE